VEGRKKKKFKKNGNSPTGAGVDPRSPAGRGSTPAPVKLFQFFLILKKDFLEVWEMGQGF
jgi:hypothetical protein